MRKNRFLGIVALFLLVIGTSAWAGGACCAKAEGVTRQVEMLPNGVKITLTAKDPDAVAQLQTKVTSCGKEGCKDCPMHAEGVTRQVEKVPQGVVITATSSNAQLVAALQQHAQAMGQGCNHNAEKKASCSKEGAKGSCCKKGAGHSHGHS